MHVSVLLAFALALAVAVAIPGPAVFAVVSSAISRGLRPTLLMVAGLILGDLLFFALAVLGLTALARSMGEFFVIVKLAGAAYLVWLGIRLWRSSAPGGDDAATVAPVATSTRRNVLGGFLVVMSNPKAIAFYAGLLPTFVDLESLSFAEAVAMGGIVVVIVGAIPAAYAVAAAGSRRFFDRPDRLTLLNRTAGTVLIGTGVAVAAR